MKLHTFPEEFQELITVVANEKHISESVGDVRKLSQREAYVSLFECACRIEGVDREILRRALCDDFTAREKGSVPFALRK